VPPDRPHGRASSLPDRGAADHHRRLHVLLDPPDSLRVQRAIEGPGRPGLRLPGGDANTRTQSVGLLLQDLVRATGAPVPPDWGPLTRGMVSATTDLLQHARVRDV
jgi:hypothetical protein